MTKGPAPTPPESRFWKFVDQQDGDACWLWTGATNGRYGRLGVGRYGQVYAHRLSYEMHVGPIPPGKIIDHICRNTLCVRPDHLRVATYRQNVENSVSTYAPAAAMRSGRCAVGHPLELRSDGRRRCKVCDRARARERMRRIRATG